MISTLDKVPIGRQVRVKKIDDGCLIKRRLLDIGFIAKTEVKPIFESPFKDPHAYLVRGSVIAIRNRDARGIEVEYV